MVIIRQAALRDLDAITAIYNDAIVRTTATFDIEPKNSEQQTAWFNEHDSKYKILVAEVDTEIIGWASLSRWSDRCAYADTAECSVYVQEDKRNRGTGRKLLDALVDEARESGLHTLIARIAEGNGASIHLCELAGFRHIGTMKEVGRKFGRRLDVHLMQLMLGE
jgi:phosphinothricin acetyltransferase